MKRRKLESTGADRSELGLLLEAAKADPWDDGPRLAVADWLEENGGEADRARAEVIRLQLDEANGGPDWGLAVQRLRDKWVREWAGAWRGLFSEILPACERGLLVAGARANAWQKETGPPDDDWAWIETVRPASFKGRELSAFAASPLMATVPALELVGSHLGLGGLRAALKPRGATANLRRLGLRTDEMELGALLALVPASVEGLRLQGYGDAAPLLDWGHSGLQELELSEQGGVDDDFAARLAGAGMACGLSCLALVYPETLTAAGFSELAKLGLRHLRLQNAQVGGEGLALLRDSACDATLETLLLFNCPGPMGRPSKPPRLRRLGFTDGQLKGAQVAILGSAGLFDGLSELNLAGNSLRSEGVAGLIDAMGRGPRTLWLGGCGVGNGAAARLAAWPGLASVRCLRLEFNKIGARGLEALAESPHASSLEALDIGGNPGTTPEAVAILLRSPVGKRLTWLNVVDSDSPEMAAVLAENGPPTLRQLRFDPFRMPAGVMSRLRAALPGCAVGL